MIDEHLYLPGERVKGEKEEKYSFGNAIERLLDVVENTSVKTLFISRASQLNVVPILKSMPYYLK